MRRAAWKAAAALALVSWLGWAVAGFVYLYRMARAEALSEFREELRTHNESAAREMKQCIDRAQDDLARVECVRGRK